MCTYSRMSTASCRTTRQSLVPARTFSCLAGCRTGRLHASANSTRRRRQGQAAGWPVSSRHMGSRRREIARCASWTPRRRHWRQRPADKTVLTTCRRPIVISLYVVAVARSLLLTDSQLDLYTGTRSTPLARSLSALTVQLRAVPRHNPPGYNPLPLRSESPVQSQGRLNQQNHTSPTWKLNFRIGGRKPPDITSGSEPPVRGLYPGGVYVRQSWNLAFRIRTPFL